MSAFTSVTPLDKKSQPNFKKSKTKLRRSNAFYGGGSDRVEKSQPEKVMCDGCGSYDCTDKNCYDRYNYESGEREEDWDW